jgi:glutamate-ammonia-ligase adenylyltransferase
MGKLASRELTYGSDLDVIFVYDLPGASDDEYVAAQEFFVRLAQKLIWALQTRTVEGVCYQVDSRLRPSGNQGTLVTSLSSLRRYHERSAAVWERQALLRARAVAGGEDLTQQFGQLRLEILRRPLVVDAAAEIRRIRRRVETELAHETNVHHDFKTGRGGLMDIECVVQYLQLLHGAQHEELFQVDGIGAQIDRLERLRHLSTGDAATLRRGWSFLQRLSSRLRIVENRSISDLDEERGDLQDLALQLGYAAGQRSAARRALLDDYRGNTAAVRDVYERVLRENPPEHDP